MTQRNPIALPGATDTARPAPLLQQCSADFATNAPRRAQDHRDDAHLVPYSQPTGSSIREPLYGAAADAVREQLHNPAELATAIRVGQRMLDAYGMVDGADLFAYAQAHGGLTEALRILLRSLGAPVNAEVTE